MNTIGLLATRPELVEELRSSNTDTAIEEFLRVSGPARSMYERASNTKEEGKPSQWKTTFCFVLLPLTMTLKFSLTPDL